MKPTPILPVFPKKGEPSSIKVRIPEARLNNEGSYLGVDFIYHASLRSGFELDQQFVRNELSLEQARIDGARSQKKD
jgi:hypothetical protein